MFIDDHRTRSRRRLAGGNRMPSRAVRDAPRRLRRGRIATERRRERTRSTRMRADRSRRPPAAPTARAADRAAPPRGRPAAPRRPRPCSGRRERPRSIADSARDSPVALDRVPPARAGGRAPPSEARASSASVNSGGPSRARSSSGIAPRRSSGLARTRATAQRLVELLRARAQGLGRQLRDRSRTRTLATCAGSSVTLLEYQSAGTRSSAAAPRGG